MPASFENVPILPRDEAFAITADFTVDNDTRKVSLGAGVYRDENSKPWILPSVKAVRSIPASEVTGFANNSPGQGHHPQHAVFVSRVPPYSWISTLSGCCQGSDPRPVQVVTQPSGVNPDNLRHWRQPPRRVVSGSAAKTKACLHLGPDMGQSLSHLGGCCT